MPSFAAKWLMPRLGGFRERHPDIDVRISANSKLADFAREDVDVCHPLRPRRLAGCRSTGC